MTSKAGEALYLNNYKEKRLLNLYTQVHIYIERANAIIDAYVYENIHNRHYRIEDISV